MGKETIVKKLNLQPDELELKYYKTFSSVIREKFTDNTSPLCWVCFPRYIGYKNAYSNKKENEIYERCLKENKPWQEYKDIVEHILAWQKEIIDETKRETDRII